MKKPFLYVAVGLLSTVASLTHADTIADWTFETTAPSGTFTGPYTSSSYAPEVGSGSALMYHATTGTISAPAGDGSAKSFSSNGWSVNDYFQFQVSTTNFSNIQLAWDQTGSSTGPSTYQLEYSLTGANGSFTSFGSPYTVQVNGSPNSAWTSSAYYSVYHLTDDLSTATDLNDQATVYFRLVDTGTVALNGGAIGTSGTDRVDNFTILGTIASAPEPSAWALGLLAAGLFALSRSLRSGLVRR